ncbi:MAG: hypothetical protein IJU23_05515 [Proteobacteria bacterium]|nr:hypothetical protein [Pseudomonadota bacterium]
MGDRNPAGSPESPEQGVLDVHNPKNLLPEKGKFVMAAKKSAKQAKISTTKKVVFKKKCPYCLAKGDDKQEMSIIKMVRHSKPSGMFWVCPKCAAEVPTKM